MATVRDYVNVVWNRVTKGKPQMQSEVWRSAVESTLSNALQRLAQRVAGDEALYPLLQEVFDFSLTGFGDQTIDVINTVNPGHTLLVSHAARRHWRLVSVGGGPRFSLKYLPHRRDLDNPPPTPDYHFYTVHDGRIIVRDSDGNIPTDYTEIQLFGNYVPIISDQVFSNGELFDDLVDIGCAIIQESGNLQEVIRQAEVPDANTPPIAPTANS